jgi:hypothetical protein
MNGGINHPVVGSSVTGYRLAAHTLLLLTLAGLTGCASRARELPGDILGLQVGLPREAAQRRLEEIGVFERDDRRRQQVWRIKDDKNYSSLAIGFEPTGEVRYVTAFADATKERVRFSEIGDLASARKEVTEPHHRYTWEHPSGNKIIAYGTEPEYLSSLSLAKPAAGTGSGPAAATDAANLK